MADRLRPQFTIGNGMGLIAIVALVWATINLSGTAQLIAAVLTQLFLLVALPIGLVYYFVTNSIGIGCPNCGKKTLERRALRSFGARFYLCRTCGLRCKRVTFGAWADASGPLYDAFYEKKAEDDPWTAPPGLEDEDLIFSKTHGNLIRNKRLRRPDDPNGPGLE